MPDPALFDRPSAFANPCTFAGLGGRVVLLLAGALGLFTAALASAAPAAGKPEVKVGDSCPVPHRLTAADGSLRDFAPVAAYLLAVDGKEVPAEIYQSQHSTALVISPALASPLLLRGGAIAAVALAKIEKKPDGTIDVRRDAVLTPQGVYRSENEVLTWKIGDHTEVLRPRPPLDFPRSPGETGPHYRYLSPQPPGTPP